MTNDPSINSINILASAWENVSLCSSDADIYLVGAGANMSHDDLCEVCVFVIINDTLSFVQHKCHTTIISMKMSEQSPTRAAREM